MHVIRGLRQALLMRAVSVALALEAAGVWWWVQESGVRLPWKLCATGLLLSGSG